MSAARGFSLIELAVGVAILGILMAIGIPSFTNWLRNARVRTAAESVQNGLQLARAEAVRRNTVVRFQLINDSCTLSTAGPNWIVSLTTVTDNCAVDAPTSIQIRSGGEGSAATTLAGDDDTFVFNSLGRRTDPPVADGDVAIAISSATGAACMADGGPVRCLRVEVSIGGQIRMCDPALPAGDTQAC